MRLSPFSKLILSLSLSAVSVGFAAWIFTWLVSGVHSTVIALTSIEEKLSTLEEDEKMTRTLGGLYRMQADNLARINRFFVDREEPLQFIQEVERLSRATGNKVAIDFNAQESKGGALAFKFTVEGSRKNTFLFLRLLELIPYPAAVENISFQNETLDFNSVRLTLDTKVKTQK